MGTFNPRKRAEEMPTEKEVKGMLSLPVQIPVWGMVCFLGGTIWFGGQFLEKVNQMIEGFQEMKITMAAMQKEQSSGFNDISALKTLTVQHEARLTALELRERKK